jgi:hypothetical protein
MAIMLAERLYDPEAEVMLDHLREHHAGTLPEGSSADFDALVQRFRLKEWPERRASR